MRLPLLVPTQLGLNAAISAGVRYNLYYEPGGDFSPETFICRPGLRLAASGVGSGEVRGPGYRFNGEKWWVRGNKLYSFDGTTTTQRGTLGTTTGNVSFADNGPGIFNQLMLVDGTYGYIWNSSTSTFTQITDADFPAKPVQVVYINFLFTVFDGDTQKFYVSASGDGTLWNALDFASAEYVPDNLMAIKVTQQSLALVGERSAEFWTYTGNTDFPFERFQNGVSMSGTEASFSLIEIDNGLMYLESTLEGGRRFARPAGGVATVVSPDWLNVILDQMTTVSDCFGYSFKYRGHEFAVYQFPTENKTFVCDVSQGFQWHQWTHFDEYGAHNRFLGNTHCYLNGKHYTVDRRNGNVCQLDGDFHYDNDEEIRMSWTTGHVQADGKRIRHSFFQLQCAEGVGNLNEQAPQAILEWSDDGGRTWSNEYLRSMGAQGKYGTRVKWNRLGMARDRVYRVSLPDPVRRVVTAQEVELAAA